MPIASHAMATSMAMAAKKSYLVGFALSGILTFIPFWLVMAGRSAIPGWSRS
jgi:heme/copper-type cytochrome/quinol oxidase subunit 4